MIDRFVAVCLNKRWLALVAFLLMGVFGYYSFTTLAIEAYPDISDTQAQVIAQHLRPLAHHARLPGRRGRLLGAHAHPRARGRRDAA